MAEELTLTTTSATADMVNKPNLVNALIMKALTGDKLSDAEGIDVQRHLNGLHDKRFNVGTEDGKMGAKTWEAIARYAKAGHLKGEKIDVAHLKHMEASLKAIGYSHISDIRILKWMETLKTIQKRSAHWVNFLKSVPRCKI